MKRERRDLPGCSQEGPGGNTSPWKGRLALVTQESPNPLRLQRLLRLRENVLEGDSQGGLDGLPWGGSAVRPTGPRHRLSRS